MQGMVERALVVAYRAAFVVGTGAMVIGCSPTYPNCDNDDQCHEGEFCVNGRCQDCRDDSHCPRGQQCNEGICARIPGWCDSDADCAPSEMCQNNRCVARPAPEPMPEPTPVACQLQSVYFGFDESGLDDSARNALDANRNCIGERSIQRVQITGMCDPRGTEEYNMALGDRRARSVRDHMQRLGVDRNTLSIHSVGEERASGYDESSWARDRRAEFSEQ